MKLKNLKVNNKIELRDGTRFKIIFSNENFCLAVNEDGKNYFDTGVYNEDLTSKISSKYDIVKVETLTKTIELNKECKEKNNLDKLQELADEMMEYVDSLDNDDKDFIKEREKLRKLYKQLKNKKRNIDNLNIDSIKYEKDGDTTTISIEGTGNLSDIIENL